MVNGSSGIQEWAGLPFGGKTTSYHSKAGIKTSTYRDSKCFRSGAYRDFLQNGADFSRELFFNQSLACFQSLKGFPFLFFLLGIVFSSCSAQPDGQLQYRNRQQAATIQSLNQEIQRLNDEIRQLLDDQGGLQRENAELRQKLSTAP